MFSFHEKCVACFDRTWSDMIGHWFMAYGDWNRSFSCMRRSTKTLSAFFSLLKRFVHGNLASGSGLLCETMINWFHYSFKHLFDDVLAWKTIGQWVSEKPKSINPGLSDQRPVFSLNSRDFFYQWYGITSLTWPWFLSRKDFRRNSWQIFCHEKDTLLDLHSLKFAHQSFDFVNCSNF